MFPIPTDAGVGTVQNVTVASVCPPGTLSNNATLNRQGWVFAGCLHQGEDRWGAKLRSAHRWTLFFLRNAEPRQIRSPASYFIGMYPFLCLNKDREWLKGCEKPAYFKVRVETDTGRDVSCVKGPGVCQLILDRCCEYNSPPPPQKVRWRGEEFISRPLSLRPLALKHVRIVSILKYCQGKAAVVNDFRAGAEDEDNNNKDNKW